MKKGFFDITVITESEAKELCYMLCQDIFKKSSSIQTIKQVYIKDALKNNMFGIFINDLNKDLCFLNSDAEIKDNIVPHMKYCSIKTENMSNGSTATVTVKNNVISIVGKIKNSVMFDIFIYHTPENSETFNIRKNKVKSQELYSFWMSSLDKYHVNQYTHMTPKAR